MKTKIISLFLALSFGFNFSAFSQEYPTLGQFLNAFPEMSRFRPSLNLYHPSKEENFAEIEGKTYECRYISFTDTNKVTDNQTLAELIASEGLANEKVLPMTNNLNVSILTFYASEKLKAQNIIYTLTFRILGDEE